MPHHEGDEKTGGDITDRIAKESDDSTASDHPMHGKAHAMDHKAAPGPVQSQDIGEPASKEELKKRSDELNKDA